MLSNYEKIGDVKEKSSNSFVLLCERGFIDSILRVLKNFKAIIQQGSTVNNKNELLFILQNFSHNIMCE